MTQLPKDCAPIQYGLHVTNIIAQHPCPAFTKIKWRLAVDSEYDRELCCYPMTFMTTSLQRYYSQDIGVGLPNMSIYPCDAPAKTRHWRRKIPMEIFNEEYVMFEVIPPRKYQDFFLFVKSREASRFQRRPDLFTACHFDHRSLGRRHGHWYSTVYMNKELGDRYCKVGVIGAISLPICVRASEKLLLEAAAEVTPDLIGQVVGPGEKVGWTGRDTVVLIQKRFEFLRRHRCKSWKCSEANPVDATQLAKEIIELVWMYSEWFEGTEEQIEASRFYRERFTPKMINLVHKQATHKTSSVSCKCPCDHWDVVGKIKGNYREVLDGDDQVAAILNKFGLLP